MTRVPVGTPPPSRPPITPPPPPGPNHPPAYPGPGPTPKLAPLHPDGPAGIAARDALCEALARVRLAIRARTRTA